MTTTELTKHEAVPVSISNTVIYCDSFRAASARSIAEESTADGGSVFTNNAGRSTKLIFSGRVYSENASDFVYSFNALVKSSAAFNVEYMGLCFNSCRMLAYTLDNKKSDWADVKVTLFTKDNITRSNEI
jgi:hypothetical protein